MRWHDHRDMPRQRCGARGGRVRHDYHPHDGQRGVTVPIVNTATAAPATHNPSRVGRRRRDVRSSGRQHGDDEVFDRRIGVRSGPQLDHGQPRPCDSGSGVEVHDHRGERRDRSGRWRAHVGRTSVGHLCDVPERRRVERIQLQRTGGERPRLRGRSPRRRRHDGHGQPDRHRAADSGSRSGPVGDDRLDARVRGVRRRQQFEDGDHDDQRSHVLELHRSGRGSTGAVRQTRRPAATARRSRSRSSTSAIRQRR